MTDPIGALIAEYAEEVASRDSVEAARADVETAKAALAAAEHRITRAKEYRNMQRAKLNHAVTRLARLLA